MNVKLSFIRLISRIQPTSVEYTKGRFHAATIRSRLQKSFKLVKLLLIGSHPRKSAIKKHSDVDLLAVFSRSEARWGDTLKSSSTFLNNIRDDLRERFWQTEISRDKQAVVVSFGAGEFSVDVVPSVFWGIDEKRRPIYLIPDGEGDWMETSPEQHARHIVQEDERSGGKLKRTAQLIKFFRECRSPRIPLSSFHIELLLSEYEICLGARSYSQCITNVFKTLIRRECRGIRDPLGISGIIGAVKSETQRESALRSVEYAYDHASRALAAEGVGNHEEACRQWNIVFNGNFPH